MDTWFIAEGVCIASTATALNTSSRAACVQPELTTALGALHRLLRERRLDVCAGSA